MPIKAKKSDRKVAKHSESQAEYRRAITPEAREQQLIALAVDAAEQQLRDGTASSQVITHYLKLASNQERTRLENEKLEEENKLLRAKTKALEDSADMKELYKDAIKAFRVYNGDDAEDD